MSWPIKRICFGFLGIAGFAVGLNYGVWPILKDRKYERIRKEADTIINYQSKENDDEEK